MLLAGSTDAFDEAISSLMKLAPADFAVPDKEVWTADVQATATTVDATIKDGSGAPRPNTMIEISILYDDFLHASTLTAMTDASGVAHFTFPADLTSRGTHGRYIHVTAGPEYPLVEKIVAITP
jgi:hypothetical protein